MNEMTINPGDLPYVPTQEDFDKTRAAEQQLNRDPLARIRPITAAIHAAVIALEPRFPNVLLQQHLTDPHVFKFLCELEKQGYTIVPVE